MNREKMAAYINDQLAKADDKQLRLIYLLISRMMQRSDEIIAG